MATIPGQSDINGKLVKQPDGSWRSQEYSPNGTALADQYTGNSTYATDAGYQNRMSYGGALGGATDAANRAQAMGAASNNRAAPTADYGGYNSGLDAYGSAMGQSQEARGQQQSALALQQQAAMGNAPSAATIAGQAGMQTALANQVAAAGSARGGAMQQAAAMNNASRVNAGNQAQMTAGIQAGRAGEMAQARGGFQQATNDIRNQDQSGAGLGLQQANAGLAYTGQQLQNQQSQNALNQQNQQFFEGQANDISKTQLAANETAQQGMDQAWVNQQAVRQADSASDWDKLKTGIGAVGGAVSGGLSTAVTAAANTTSDSRAKIVYSYSDENTKVGPGVTSPTGDMAIKGGGLDVMGSIANINSHVADSIHNPGGGMMMHSDAGAKKRAHDEGFQKGMAWGYGAPVTPPAAPTDPRDDAAATVDAKRARGEYAQNLDLTPIPQGAVEQSNLDKGMRDAAAGPYGEVDGDYGSIEAQSPYQGHDDHPAPGASPAGGGPPSWLKVLSGALGGASRPAPPPGSYQYGDHYSDEGTKNRVAKEAFASGVEHGEAKAQTYVTPVTRVEENGTLAANGKRYASVSPTTYATRPVRVEEPLPKPRRMQTFERGDNSGRAVSEYQDPESSIPAAERRYGPQSPGRRSGVEPPPWQSAPNEISSQLPPTPAVEGGVSRYGGVEPPEYQTAPGGSYSDKDTKERGLIIASDAPDKEPRSNDTAKDSRGNRPVDLQIKRETGKETPEPMSPTGVARHNEEDDDEIYRAMRAAGAPSPENISWHDPSWPAVFKQKDKRDAYLKARRDDFARDHRAPPSWLERDEVSRGEVVPGKAPPIPQNAMEEDANRRMAAEPYSYKDGFVPPEQRPGEMNYGPMAQNLEKNPITATTVKKDPAGVRVVDLTKLAKVHSGAIANLQGQLDELKYGQ